MGNHVAGQAMGQAAETAVAIRVDGEAALAILDRICRKYRGADAEWETEDRSSPGMVNPDFEQYTDPHPKAALGMLMVEAFAPNGLADLPKYAPMLDTSGSASETQVDDASNLWIAEVYEPFKKRFEFC